MTLPISHCHGCDIRPKSCDGVCPCPRDGRSIRDHASAGYCPDKKYGDGVAPAGWADVPIVSRGLGDTIAKLTRAVGIKPCGGCKQRQAALNRLLPY